MNTINQKLQDPSHFRIHEAGRKYFESDKNEKEFTKLYLACKDTVYSISKSILKDTERAKDNVSRVFLKIHTNKSFVFDYEKSFFSWLSHTTKNSAIVMFNQVKSQTLIIEDNYGEQVKVKVKPEYTESELIPNTEEEVENTLDYLFYHNNSSKDFDTIDIESNDKRPFTENLTLLEKRVSDIIDDISGVNLNHRSEKEKQTAIINATILKKRLIEDVGPNALQEMFKDDIGSTSRITFTTRRRRAIEKIKAQLEIDFNGIKISNREKVSGEFKLYHDNGNVKFHASVSNNKLDGDAIFFSLEGDIVKKYQFKNGKKNGICIDYHSNGNKKIATNFIEGFKHGREEEFFENGFLKKSLNYYWDYKHGEYVEFHSDNSCKLKGNYEYNNKTGRWRKFYEGNLKDLLTANCGVIKSGMIDEDSIYDKGKITTYLYDESGEVEKQVFNECSYAPLSQKEFKRLQILDIVNRNGIYKEFYLNGNIKLKGEYKSGIKIGEWVRYNEDGTIDEKVTYKGHEAHFQLFDEKGTLSDKGVLNVRPSFNFQEIN